MEAGMAAVIVTAEAGMVAAIAAVAIPAVGAAVVVGAIKLASNLYSVQRELTGVFELWVLFKYSQFRSPAATGPMLSEILKQ
jgi:hypothetical protein